MIARTKRWWHVTLPSAHLQERPVFHSRGSAIVSVFHSNFRQSAYMSEVAKASRWAGVGIDLTPSNASPPSPPPLSSLYQSYYMSLSTLGVIVADMTWPQRPPALPSPSEHQHHREHCCHACSNQPKPQFQLDRKIWHVQMAAIEVGNQYVKECLLKQNESGP